MVANTNVWDKLTRLVIFLLFVAYLIGVGVWYLPLIQLNERYRVKMLHEDALIAKQEQTHKQLKAAIDALQHNPKAMERLGRERLNLGKPGETIIRFESPTANQGQ